ASSRREVTAIGASPTLVTRYVQTIGVPAARSGPGAASASSAAVGKSGLTALIAFLTVSRGSLPRKNALSSSVTVPVPRAAVTVAVLPYNSTSGAGKLITPAEVYSHTSPGSSRWLLFRSPLTYTGEKSSAVVAVPLSSTSDVIVSGVLLGLVTRYVQTTGVPAESGRGSCMSSASSTAVGASGLAALTAFLRMTPWVVPTWYAGSRAKTVPAELVAETVA